MNDLPPLKIAFISRRPFADGPVTTPIPENDPANIAFVLGGDYFSFFTLDKLSRSQVVAKLAPYDLVFLALDHRALDTVVRIAAACGDRLVTYSEGNIADYQQHGPAGQASFLQIINRARVNFLYWERYVPFYRTLTDRPVYYLPYPYFYEEAATFTVPHAARQRHVTLPSGFAGHTRNGLASLAAARRLLRQGDIAQVNCWMNALHFEEDAQAVRYFMLGAPPPQRPPRFNWRRWLKRSGFDYRFLLRLKNRWRQPDAIPPPPPLVSDSGLALYRRRTWRHYVPEMAKTMLVIDMNSRETVGRNALDCAAVGVPCLSTNRSDAHERLFPDLVLADSWDVEGAVALSRRLLGDPAFYHGVTARARAELPRFGPEAFRQRITALFTEHPELLLP